MERIITYAEAVREATEQEMARDPSVIVLGIGVDDFKAVYGTTRGLQEKFGRERVFDTPLSEDGMTGLAIGAAFAGLRPIHVHIRMDFVLLAMNQITNIAAKARYMYGGAVSVPIVVRSVIGRSWGQGAQHSQGLHALFMHIPGLRVVAPSTPYDAKGCLIQSIRDDNPVMFIEHKLLYATQGEVPDADYTVPLGVADVKRDGRDITVVATSRVVHLAMAAADRLATQGIEVEVVDPRTLVPLDEEAILASVKKTNRLVIAQEATPRCSVASEIAAIVTERAFDDLDAPIARVTALPTPVPFAPALEQHVLPDEEKLIAAVHAALQ